MILLVLLALITFNAFFKKNKKLFWFSAILLILFAGLRYDYGYDYQNYYTHYYEINSLKDVYSSIYEFGYSFLVFCFRSLGFDFIFFSFILAFLSIGLKVYTINKLSDDPYISLLIYLLLFYVFNDLEQVRQGMALGICFFSLIFLYKKKRLPIFIMLVLIATSIHYSSIFFVTIPLFKLIRGRKKLIFGFMMISSLFLFIDLADLLRIVNDYVLNNEYLRVKLISYSSNSLTVFSPTILIRLFILFFCSYDFTINKIDFEKKYLSIYYANIVFLLVLSSIEVFASRVSLSMRYSEILIVPSIKVNNIYCKYIYCSLFVYYFYSYISTIINPVYWNYNFIFSI